MSKRRVTYNLVHGLVEEVVLAKHEQDDERHVDVVRVPLLRRVQDLQNGNHLKKQTHSCKILNKPLIQSYLMQK